MITAQYLLNNSNTAKEFNPQDFQTDFLNSCQNIDKNKVCLVQIFTSALLGDEAVALAQLVQQILPNAKIIGSSVNCVIYRNEQYDNATLIVVEQYKNCQVEAHLCNIENKDAPEVVDMMVEILPKPTPQHLRLFAGAYYDQAHQLMEGVNEKLTGMQVAGGISGEIYQSNTIPFVFDSNNFYENGIAFAALSGKNLSIYSRINTAHEVIGPVYTITKGEGRIISTIDNEDASKWIQRNLGFAATNQYSTWEEIADNDPLVRFRLALEDYDHASRFLQYQVEQMDISQYFSRLATGTKFRISYTSPAKCVAECKETCYEVQETPIEQLFCYNCLFRKLYLKNCAQWELTPYHNNPISGVFLLGEFGYSSGKNQLLNGSCVLSGLAEDENYLDVDLNCLEEISSIQTENEGLMDFIMRKQFETQSLENVELLSSVMSNERTHSPELYRYIDPNLNLHNMLKYELDKDEFNFDKICLIKIENADMLLGHMGQRSYYNLLNSVIMQINHRRTINPLAAHSHIYAAGIDSFVMADAGMLSEMEFLELINNVQDFCLSIQKDFEETPILMRYVVICGGDFLLERAYGQLELHRNSQTQIITEKAQPMSRLLAGEELSTINVIQMAITQNKIVPYYQGLHNNETGCIDKYEALMRIHNREGNILTPYAFMDVAKRYRLYLDLNLKMFQAVLNDFKNLKAEVTINLSAHDITSPRFIYEMEKELKKFPDPSRITFEILEDEYFTDMQILKDFIALARSYGAKIAIDDFGAGYSNLLEIIKIHPDYLKIDGQIIREVHRSIENEAIVEVMAALGRKLGIELVAEFVENQEIQSIVEKYNIVYSQGYYFARPEPFWKICEISETLNCKINNQKNNQENNQESEE